ncbi:MAG: hypothetical protein ACI976_000173 [Aureispira sp.]|jgi:hypothetical protein
MKNLLLTWVIVFLTIGLGWAQTEKKVIQNFIPEEDCYFAVFALNGPTTVQKWDQPTIKIIYTVKVENADAEVTNHQIEMKFYEEERVLIFELPNQEEDVLMNAEMIGDLLEVEVFVPKGIKYHVVPTNLHPLM